ncbi:tyrosine-protein kinase STYK1 [Trichomycterus rosablanca]|uniref:tyrosine-protein kinase STYK1 n=1 Tax=Trichomycterus rosablanca TaxID=2290929 RepID=UPI002F360594
MSNSSTSNETSLCDSKDTLCVIRVYQVEIIVIPVLLLALFFIGLLTLCVLMLIQKKEKRAAKYQSYTHNGRKVQGQNRRSRNSRHHLQGIDAPAQFNPMEFETLPMTEQTRYQSRSQPADLQMFTQMQYNSFQQITPLPVTLTWKPDHSVTLYRATVDQRPVVLRVLKETANATERHAFLGFAQFLSELGPHSFLPSLLGVVTARASLVMVLEELENRDLLGFLWRCRQNQPGQTSSCHMTEKLIFRMAVQIASALAYLHSRNCTHGNLGARSVLVGRDLSVKLWGLGPAFCRKTSMGSSGEVEELKKWQAPEVLVCRPVSHSGDIWSFGILLYEMGTLGDPPFPEIPPSELLQYLQRGKTLKRPANCSSSLYSIIKACCRWAPQDRAPLNEVISKLQLGERNASDSVVLRVPEPLNMEKYMHEAGFGEFYNYAVI